MRFRRQLCLLLPLLSCLVPLSAPAAGIDLAEAWRLAVHHDPALSAARAELLADREREPQSRAALLPSAQLSANTSDNMRDIQGAFSEDFNTHGWSATLTQGLFRPEEWFDLRTARALNEQARIEFAGRVEQLMVDVAGAYFNVLRARDDLASAQAEEAALHSQLEQAQERFDVGLVARTEVLEARAAYDAAHADRVIQAGIVDITRETLESRVGQPFETVAGLQRDFPVNLPEPHDREAWVRVALQGNHRLQAARAGIAVADQDIAARRSEHLPTVDFIASYRRNVQGGLSFLGGKVNDRTYTLEFNLPLTTGGFTRSRVREAEYRRLSAEETARAVARDVSEDIRILHRQVSSNVLSVQARQQAVISARSALEATETGYEVGTRNAVDVLQSKRNVFASERDYANARYDYVINLFLLKQAAGTLSPADFDLLNKWLD